MTPSLSNTPKTMSFSDALRKVAEGRRIARITWHPSPDYGVMKDGFLTIFTTKEGAKTPAFHKWLVNDGDMNNEDWIVLHDLT